LKIKGRGIPARACYQLDPIDKVLQIMTALEMFALRNDNEPIQAAPADRLAFATTDDPNIQQEIVDNLRAAYGLRSGRTHHVSQTQIPRRSSSFCGTLGRSF